MTIEEYNGELGILRGELETCKQNKEIIQTEKNILKSITISKDCEREIIKLRQHLNEKRRLNSAMIDALKWSISHLKANTDNDEVYEHYRDMYKDIALQYINKSQDLDYLALADKYIGDVTLFVQQ